MRHVRGGDAVAKDGLVEVGHLDELVLDVRCACNAVVICDGSSRADEHVAKAGLADIRPAMVAGKALYQHRCIVVLAIHKDQLVWNEHVVEYHHGFLAAVLAVACVNFTLLHAPRVTRLSAIDVGDARSVDRHCANDGIILVLCLQSHSRHDQYPVRVDASCLVRLGAGDIDALFIPIHNVHKHVRVGLLRR